MPDADGNFKGIAVPDLPWLHPEDKAPDLKAWDEACLAAMRRSLQQAEQDQPSRGEA